MDPCANADGWHEVFDHLCAAKQAIEALPARGCPASEARRQAWEDIADMALTDAATLRHRYLTAGLPDLAPLDHLDEQHRTAAGQLKQRVRHEAGLCERCSPEAGHCAGSCAPLAHVGMAAIHQLIELTSANTRARQALGEELMRSV